MSAGDVAGNSTVELIGYGFDSASGNPQVSVGGSPASVTNVTLTPTGQAYQFPIETLTFITPPGAKGLDDITVTTSYGSTTVKNGFQYISHNLVTGIYPFQMVLDKSRGLLYVSDINSGAVKAVNTATLSVNPLFNSSSSPATAIALTSDFSKLLILSGKGGTLTVFDLNAQKAINTIYPVPGNLPTQMYPDNVVATSRGTALVSAENSALFDGGDLYEVDLVSGNATTIAPPSFQTIARTLFAPSADGTQILLAEDTSLGQPGSTLALYSSATDTIVRLKNFEGSSGEICSTSAGDRFLVDGLTYSQGLTIVDIPAINDRLANLRGVVRGQKIHSTGSLEYIPTTTGVEVYDVHHGPMVLSIAIPGGVASTFDGLAIDQTGTQLFYADANGLGVIQLPSAPLSIGAVVPVQGSAVGGETITVLGSGFLPGATVSLDGHSVPAQVLSSTQLTFVSPAVSGSKVQLVINNPGGASYSLDAAFDASVHSTTALPVLTSVVPLTVQPGYSGDITINGSGFVNTSQIFLNGQPIQTQYLSVQQIVGYFYGTGPAQTALLTVSNPAPGGGVSNSLPFNIQDTIPVIGSLSPSTLPAGSPAFELTVSSNFTFAPDSVVLWNGSQRPTLFVNGDQLIAQITVTDVSAVGTANVTVKSPSASTPMSAAIPFTITPQVPLITVQPNGLTFNSVIVGSSSSPATVTVNSTGQLPLQISSITLADKTNFSQTNNCPASLPVGKSCTIQVSFTPPVSTPLGTVLFSQMTIANNSSSSPQVVALTGDAADYNVSVTAGAAFTVSAGQTATVPLQVQVLGGSLGSPIQFSCSGLPTGAACTFSSESFTPSVGTVPITLTISTTSRSSAALLSYGYLMAGIPFVLAIGWIAVRRRRAVFFLACVLSSVILASTSCGGGSGSSPPPPPPNGTPVGTYTITVNAAYSSSVNRSVTITLTVN